MIETAQDKNPLAGRQPNRDNTTQKTTALSSDGAEVFIIKDGPCGCGLYCGWMDGLSIEEAARLVEKSLKDRLQEDFRLGEFKNIGRGYLAHMYRPDGSLLNDVYVDKQTGNLRFIRGLLTLKTADRQATDVRFLQNEQRCLSIDCAC